MLCGKAPPENWAALCPFRGLITKGPPGATLGIVPKYTTQMARTQIGLPVYSAVGHPILFYVVGTRMSSLGLAKKDFGFRVDKKGSV